MSGATADMDRVAELLRGGGPAIPFAFRGASPDGRLLLAYADSLCAFLKDLDWLFECHITEFFTDSLWCALLAPVASALRSLSCPACDGRAQHQRPPPPPLAHALQGALPRRLARGRFTLLARRAQRSPRWLRRPVMASGAPVVCAAGMRAVHVPRAGGHQERRLLAAPAGVGAACGGDGRRSRRQEAPRGE